MCLNDGIIQIEARRQPRLVRDVFTLNLYEFLDVVFIHI